MGRGRRLRQVRGDERTPREERVGLAEGHGVVLERAPADQQPVARRVLHLPGQREGRRALVPEQRLGLGGGGVLGASEVGMVRALAEHGIRPDVVLGTSIGAMNGAFIAADPGVVDARIDGTGPSSLATIIYTSGTTGRPKGVRLRHDTWTYQGAAIRATGMLSAVHRNQRASGGVIFSSPVTSATRSAPLIATTRS